MLSKTMTMLITICTALTFLVICMSILKKDYRQTIEFLVGYTGFILMVFQSVIANWIVKLF